MTPSSPSWTHSSRASREVNNVRKTPEYESSSPRPRAMYGIDGSAGRPERIWLSIYHLRPMSQREHLEFESPAARVLYQSERLKHRPDEYRQADHGGFF